VKRVRQYVIVWLVGERDRNESGVTPAISPDGISAPRLYTPFRLVPSVPGCTTTWPIFLRLPRNKCSTRNRCICCRRRSLYTSQRGPLSISTAMILWSTMPSSHAALTAGRGRPLNPVIACGSSMRPQQQLRNCDLSATPHRTPLRGFATQSTRCEPPPSTGLLILAANPGALNSLFPRALLARSFSRFLFTPAALNSRGFTIFLVP
jgi:hypothetical protein